MQSSPASAREGQSLRGGWATPNPATTLNQIQGVPETGLSQPRGDCQRTCGWPKLLSYDSHKSQLGGKVAWDTPTYSLKVQISIQLSPCKFAKRVTWRMCAGS